MKCRDAMEDALGEWKKKVRDSARKTTLRYSDAFRAGWLAAEWEYKAIKRLKDKDET